MRTFGNLTLTTVNSELSNNPFERKKDLLNASHLEMNRRIAGTPRWGAAEILTRADELADQTLAALPDGTWTTYEDLAALIGSSAQPVGQHLVKTPGVMNAYRVLAAEGRVVDGFRWPEGAISAPYAKCWRRRTWTSPPLVPRCRRNS